MNLPRLLLTERMKTMDATYRIPLSVLIKEHKFEEIYLPAPAKDISIYNPEVDRPALALSGFYEMFEASRIQLIGQAEHTYLDMMEPDERKDRLNQYMQARPITVIFTSGLLPRESASYHLSETVFFSSLQHLSSHQPLPCPSLPDGCRIPCR